MKNLTILFISLFLVNVLNAQEHKVIKITNQATQKEIDIKENKRIIIKTVDDKKISGRFIIENNSVIINNEKLEITDIEYLKRDPLLTSILTTGLLVYGGAVTAGFGVIIGLFADPNGFLLTIPAAGLIYAGIKSPNFHKRYSTEKNWIFETTTISE